MNFVSLKDFVAHGGAHIGKGPVALLLMEDLTETNSTIRHHQRIGFRDIVVFGPDALDIAPELREQVVIVSHDLFPDGAFAEAVNATIAAFPDRWFYYGYNAEYLFFPFCESRSIRELVSFATEERRDSILTYVIDLYAGDLGTAPAGVALEDAHLDQSGYYAQGRTDAATGVVQERQLDMYGGVRWRFEEHVPPARRRIDRIGIFRAQKGLVLRPDHTFNIAEYNTYACPWHHSLTAAVCSFRAAKALRANPDSAHAIGSFTWHNSRKFAWHSQQLMDMGLMEPGQWF